jgi:hypothetical protein
MNKLFAFAFIKTFFRNIWSNYPLQKDQTFLYSDTSIESDSSFYSFVISGFELMTSKRFCVCSLGEFCS